MLLLLFSSMISFHVESSSDSDYDGVEDFSDLCKDTFRFSEVDDFGCSFIQNDEDNDGILNEHDKCPESVTNICSPYYWVHEERGIGMWCSTPEFTKTQLVIPCKQNDGGHGGGETGGYVYNLDNLNLDKIIPRVTRSSYSEQSDLLAVVVSGDSNPNEKFRIYDGKTLELLGEYSANGSVTGITWNNSGDDFIIEINRGGNHVGYVQKYVVSTSEILDFELEGNQDNYTAYGTDLNRWPVWPKHSPDGAILYDLEEDPDYHASVLIRLKLEYIERNSTQIFYSGNRDPDLIYRSWISIQAPEFKQTSDMFAMSNGGGFEIFIGDYDGDGINFVHDQCYHTQQYLKVDKNGCSLDQLDSDGDLVPDSIDYYPDDPDRYERIDFMMIAGQYALPFVGSILIIGTGIFLHKPTLQKCTNAIRRISPNAIGLERIERQREELDENVTFEVNMDSLIAVILSPFIALYFCVIGLLYISLVLIQLYLIIAAYALLIVFGGAFFIVLLPLILVASFFG